MSVIFLDNYRTSEAKAIHEVVKYVHSDLQAFLAANPGIESVSVLGAVMWEMLALLESEGYDPTEVAQVVLQNFYRVKGETQ